MKSIERLVAEHKLIERGLNLLEKAVTRLEADQSVPDEFLMWVPNFFKHFADRCHHAKEETVLFPLLAERGIPEERGPLGVMLVDHQLGREFIVRLVEANQSDPFDRRAFIGAARPFIHLLRRHIFKENSVLFPMAKEVMTTADDELADIRFSQVERERGLANSQETFRREVDGWEARVW